MKPDKNKKDAYIQELELRLQRQSEEYAHTEKVQKALYSISELASGAESLSEFYHSIHQIISELVYAENFYIALVDKKRQSLDFEYFVDSIDDEVDNENGSYTISLSDQSLSTYVYGLKKAALLDKTKIMALENSKTIKRLGPPSNSWLGAPLIADDCTLGIIVVQSYSRDFIYREWHRELFDYIANVVATTIDRKQNKLDLESRVVQRTIKLQKEIDLRKRRDTAEKSILAIVEDANSNMPLSHFYQALHQNISKLIYAKNFYIALKADNSDDLRFVYFIDSADQVKLAEVKNMLVKATDKSMTNYQYAAKKVLMLSANEIEALIAQKKIISQGRIPSSWLAAPLYIDGEVIGIMAVQSYQSDILFSAEDRQIIEYIAKPVATAIQRKTTQDKLELLVEERTAELDATNKELIKKIDEKTQSEKLQNALYEIANLASGIEDMPIFYLQIHQILGSLFYAENFYIALVDDSGENLEFKYFSDLRDDRQLLGEKYPINNDTLSTLLFRSDKPLLIHQSEFPALMEKEKIKNNGVPFVSWLGVPLRENNRSIGIMVVQSYIEDVVYESWHRELLEYVSNQVAMTLIRKKDRSELEKNVLERTLKLEQEIEHRKKSEETQSALYYIANLANMELELNSFYKELHKIIGRLVYSENFFIALKNQDTNAISFVYYQDTKDDYDLESISEIPAEKMQKSLTVHIMNSGRSYLGSNKDIKALTKKEGLDVFGEETASWLGIPLAINNAVIGILVLQSYLEERQLTEQDKELMIFVGQHVATALQRNRNKHYLKREVEERTVELNNSNKLLKKQMEKAERSKKLQMALYQIADLASSNEELDFIYHQFHKIISQLIYADNFFIALYDQPRENLSFVYFIDTKDKLDLDISRSMPLSDLKNTYTGYVLKTGESYLKSIESLNEDVSKEIVTVGKEACFWLGVPLRINGLIIGIIVVQSYDINMKIDDWQKELLEFVSHHIAITLERKNARKALESRVKERTLELAKSNDDLVNQIRVRERSEAIQAALYKISNLANKNISLKKLFAESHSIISKLIYADNFYIALWDKANDTMDWQYFVDEKLDFDYSAIEYENINDRKKTFARYTVHTGKPQLLTRNMMLDIIEGGEVCLTGPLAEYLLAVPLVGANGPIGAMAVQSYDSQLNYSLSDQELLNFVAQSIVTTIERQEYNKQLEKRVERRTHELTISNERLQSEISQRNSAEMKLQVAYEELANKTEKAEAASKAKSAFLATVSHEIRTPMNGILGLLSLMSDTSMSNTQRDYVSKISSSATSLLSIINDILDFSKIEQGKLELEHLDFNLLHVLDHCVDLFSARLNEKNLAFNIQIDPGVQLLRIGDSLRLSQILNNLISNAIKFTNQGFIDIRIIEVDNNGLKFDIVDSGIGIAISQRSKIFETFTQADDTTTRKFGGSGLGLSICKELVSLMGGTIDIGGELGVGSCFSFTAYIDKQLTHYTDELTLSGAKILLFSEDQLQIKAWLSFCEMFDLSITIKNLDDLLSARNSANLLSSDISHIFIDETVQTKQSEDSLELIRSQLAVKTPCFLLTTPSPHMSELPNLGDDAQFITKPIKMSLILTLIQNDYDVLALSQATMSNKAIASSSLAGTKILIVEDNLINQQVAKEMLLKVGAIVVLVENGKLAVETKELGSFDVILMDMQMPVMDGYQASEIIRKKYSRSQLPIIAMTANVMKGDRQKCLSYGMNDYIGKPIDRQILFRTIEKYIKRKTNKKILQAPVIYDDFSLSVLAQKFDSDELAKQLVGLFVDTHNEDANKILTLIKQEKLIDASRVVHKLKGSCGEMDLQVLQQLCVELEKELKNQQVPTDEKLVLFQKHIGRILDIFAKMMSDA